MILVHVVSHSSEDIDRPRVPLEESRDLAVPVKVVRHLPPDDIGARVQDRLRRLDGQTLTKGDRVAADGVDYHRQGHGG